MAQLIDRIEDSEVQANLTAASGILAGLVLEDDLIYLDWEQATEQRGEQRAKRESLEALLKARLGELDDSIVAIVPQLLALPTEEYTNLILQLSREQLLARFPE